MMREDGGDTVKLGLIGLGNMGGLIGKRLIEQGNDLLVYDVNPAARQDFVSLGAEAAASPSDLAEKVNLVITVLPNAAIVKSVVFGPEGLIHGFRPGSTLIDMTSSDPAATVEIGKMLEQKGVRMLDAPVSGGLEKAKDGTLAIMVGGEEDVLQEVLPVLHSIGKHITLVGGLGSGHAMKALNNLVSATTLSITAEAMAIGVKYGIDPNKMLQVLNTSSGRNNSSEIKFPKQVLTRKFEVGFKLELMCKDLAIAMDLAKQMQVPTFISSSVFQLWQYGLSQGGGQMDHTAIVKFVEEMAGVEIKG
jgi:3-hydroxyisobutyrate dehydrogenase-like beta-hydroxyacid dehydrogenase